MTFPSQERIRGQMTHLMSVFVESEAEIRPHFFLTGESGSGKSWLTADVAQELKIPFFEFSAAQLTAEGLSGNSLSKAMRPLREKWNEPNICFVDEFDKLFQRNGEASESFRSMVQDEFLCMLESKYTSVFTDFGKYEPIRVNNTMFVFAGAFSNQRITTIAELKDAGLRTEFVGRVPLVFSTEPASLEEMKAAIPHLTLFKSYMKLGANRNLKHNTAVREVIKLMVAQFEETNIGIRLMNSVIHQYFMRDV